MFRRGNVFATAAVLLMLLAVIAPLAVALPGIGKDSEKLTWQESGDEISYQSGSSGDYQDIYLYFHKTSTSGSTYVLNTEGGSNGLDTMPSAKSVTFWLAEPLTKNLKVMGHEITPTEKGFWLDLGVSSFPSATVTIEVLDEQTVIANKTQTVSGTYARWTISFTGGLESYTFMKGNRIGVRITASGTTTVNYQSGDKLWVLCEPVGLTGDTYNANGVKTKTFYPNDVDENRFVVIKGKIDDAWGSGDVASVSIKISNAEGTTVQEATAEVEGLNYTYEWNYSKGLNSGGYSALVEMTDQQNNLYNITVDFTMATYGVKLDSPDASESGVVEGAAEKGGCTEYTVSVMNTGASSTSYTLSQSSSDISGWTLTITPTQTGSVSPGESKIVIVKVCADDGVEEGTHSVFYVQAVANSDPSAKDNIQIITRASPKINLTVRWSGQSGTCSNLVSTGGSVACAFEVQNTGLQSLNVTIKMSVEMGSPDWTAKVIPTSIMNTLLLLHPSQIVSGTLNVTAPKDPSKQNKSIVTIKAEVNDVTPSLTKSITATTVMSTGIGLEVVGDESTKIDADKYAEFFILVSNSDPNNAHTITLSTTQPTGWGIEFVASNKVFSLNSGESQTIRIKITPSSTSAAGVFTIEVTGKYQDNPSTYDKATMQVEINKKYNLVVSLLPAEDKVGADEDAEFTLTIENKGNVDENQVSIMVSQRSGDLKATIKIDNETAALKTVVIGRGQVKVYKVYIAPKDDAKHKDDGTWDITVKGASGTGTVKQVTVTLEKDQAELFNETITDWQMWTLIILTLVVVGFYVGVIRR